RLISWRVKGQTDRLPPGALRPAMVKSQAADRESEAFRSLVLRNRGRTGLTQRELAARMGSSRRTLQDWESGVNYPTAHRLQALIRVLLEAGGLTVGR